MSATLKQIYDANPIVTNEATDLMYFSRDPFTAGNDVAMSFADFSAQFAGITAAQVQHNDFNTGTDSGAANAYVVSDISPVIASLEPGMIVSFNPATNCSGASTLDVGLGAAPIYRAGTGTGIVNTTTGDIFNAINANCMWGGSFWFLLNPCTVNGVLVRTSYLAPVTSDSLSFTGDINTLALNPAGTLATLTITLPVNPIQDQEVRMSCSQIVTALTIAPGSGETILNAPTSFAAGQGFAFICDLANTTWYRIY